MRALFARCSKQRGGGISPTRALVCRGIRGAISVDADDRTEIVSATKRLLVEMTRCNGVLDDDIASVLFTLTADLRAFLPAAAAREMGWKHVPMLHAAEVPIPGALHRCIRVLMHVNTSRSPMEIEHVYLGGAVSLRPDLVPDSRSHF